MKKRLLPILLVLVMVLALVPTIALAGGSSSNVNLTADKTTANVGDTITVTVANKAMKVDTFTCGIKFDKTLLECTGITKGTNYTAMQSKGVVAPEISTVTEANAAGYVGFGVACAAENSYSANTIFTVSFKVLKEGTATISSTEVSNGTDGFNGDGMNLTLTLKKAAGGISVNVETYKSGATVTEPAGGWVAGSNTFTVSCSSACVVAISHDGGTTYIRLTATASGPAYSFTASNVADGDTIAVIMKGDINGDGKVNAVDAARVKAVSLNKSTLSGIFFMAGDVDNSTKINAVDAARVKAVSLNKSTLSW